MMFNNISLTDTTQHMFPHQPLTEQIDVQNYCTERTQNKLKTIY